MLQSIVIRNFAIIEQLELEFDDGLSVITGETGAGKSIIIDALGMVLGDRADTSVIRAKQSQSEISAIIDIGHHETAQQWLRRHDFTAETACVLRRVIHRDGKSRAYIDGTPVSLKMLKEFGEYLINIYGQHAHQGLMHEKLQRDLVDRFGGHEYLVKELNKLFREWQTSQQKWQGAQTHQDEYRAKTELLRYQTQELEQLNLQPNELESLEQQLNLLSHAEALRENAQWIQHTLDNDDSSGIYDRLAEVEHRLQQSVAMDPRLARLHELLVSAMELIKECSDELRDYGQGIEYDSSELEQVQERLAAIEDVAHKHHVKAGALCDLQQSLRTELDRFESPEFDIDQLQHIMKKNEQAFFALAGQITSARQQAATALSKAVTSEMKHLGLGKAKLQVQVSPAESPHRHGCDQVQFLVQTNPGQPAQPLAKIASGGELSRISLALQLVLLDKMQVSTMIFDEVDAGVGGATAEVVGVQLRRLGESKQVFCVTHLPQVAAKAHHHLRVNKQSSAHYTTSAVEHLDAAERVSEIARMLGGVKLTENTYSHAREMLGTNVLQ